MRRIGFLVNPIAGMGGRVGLKGTDGQVAEARARGAEPRAPERGVAALRALADTGADVALLTYAGRMGAAEATEAADAGLDFEVVGEPADEGGETTAADTRAAVRAFVECGVDLILFVGGDGTAVDVTEALDDAGDDTPVLGVPAGVKVYSAVFAVSPEAAGRVAATFDPDAVEESEVNDIDEAAYREGEVRAELRGVVRVPAVEERQASKQTHGGSVEGLAAGFATDVREGVTYVFGPGSTVGAIERELGIDPSPLGVDVYRDGELLIRDGTEAELLDALGEENVVVVSPVGGQGFVFGRGNHQLSPAVLRRSEVEIVASRRKLDGIGVLRADTGHADLDCDLRGWWKVRVGRFQRRLVELV
jgi:NAD+ kinase